MIKIEEVSNGLYQSGHPKLIIQYLNVLDEINHMHFCVIARRRYISKTQWKGPYL